MGKCLNLTRFSSRVPDVFRAPGRPGSAAAGGPYQAQGVRAAGRNPDLNHAILWRPGRSIATLAGEETGACTIRRNPP